MKEKGDSRCAYPCFFKCINRWQGICIPGLFPGWKHLPMPLSHSKSCRCVGCETRYQFPFAGSAPATSFDSCFPCRAPDCFRRSRTFPWMAAQSDQGRSGGANNLRRSDTHMHTLLLKHAEVWQRALQSAERGGEAGRLK